MLFLGCQKSNYTQNINPKKSSSTRLEWIRCLLVSVKRRWQPQLYLFTTILSRLIIIIHRKYLALPLRSTLVSLTLLLLFLL